MVEAFLWGSMSKVVEEQVVGELRTTKLRRVLTAILSRMDSGLCNKTEEFYATRQACCDSESPSISTGALARRVVLGVSLWRGCSVGNRSS
jgi:hypothetical protein